MSRSLVAKRIFDLTLAAPALVLSLPLQAIVAIAVGLRLGRPILFRQIRPGRNGQPFELLKFRSMRPVNPDAGLVEDEARLTAFGRWLRSTSLDELPGLWNVVRGEMSLVGPRPLLLEYLPHYTPEQARRHDVPPGMTGLAQVAGRNALNWEERLHLDVQYVSRRSLALDLAILTRTLGLVLKRTGISASGSATMPKFTGTGTFRGAP